MTLSNRSTRTIPIWLFYSIVLSYSALINNGCGIGEDDCCNETEEYTTTELLLQETSPMGFSADQILDKIIGKSNTIFRWRDGSESKATAEIEFDTVHINYVDYKYFDTECVDYGDRYPMNLGIEFEVEDVFRQCDRLVFGPVQVSLKTDDGNFDEVWETTGVALESNDVYLFTQRVDPSSIRGGYQIPKEEQGPNQNLSIIINYQYGSLDGTVCTVEEPDENASVIEALNEDDYDAVALPSSVIWLVGCWGSCEFCQSEHNSCNKR